MKLVALSMVALLAVTVAPSPAAATYPCMGDAPYLPGALSGYYDMWNNIWRYYTCGYVLDKILEDFPVEKLAEIKINTEGFRVVLP